MINLATIYTQTTDWLTLFLPWAPQPAPLDHIAKGEQIQQVQITFHCAYRRFAQRYPIWVNRRFDDEFLRQVIQPRRFQTGDLAQAALSLPSGHELAWAWDRQFGPLFPDAVRTHQMAELIGVATHFLRLWTTSLNEQNLALKISKQRG